MVQKCPLHLQMVQLALKLVHVNLNLSIGPFKPLILLLQFLAPVLKALTIRCIGLQPGTFERILMLVPRSFWSYWSYAWSQRSCCVGWLVARKPLR